MAGKIIADQIEHSTAGSLDTQYVVNGSAKAWVNFNGTGTVAIADNLNVASLIDNATGDYTMSFSTNMGNANYAVASHTGGAGQNVVTNRGSSGTGYTYQTTSSNRVGNRNTSDQNWNDFDLITVVFFGDLA